MTHYESIDPNKVKEIFARSFAIDKKTHEVIACKDLNCVFCLFSSANKPCIVERTNWLDQPAFDPEKDIDWSKVPVDTPVLVWDSELYPAKRYFYGVNNGCFGTYRNGCTSWSSTTGDCYYWKHCKLYRPEDVEKYRKKDTENG